MRTASAVAVAAALALAALLAAVVWPSPPEPGSQHGRAPAARQPAAPSIDALRVASGNGIATGFPVGDGRVATVAHVLAGRVTAGSLRARVLRVDRQSDLALLSVSGVRPLAPGAALPRLASAADGEHLWLVRVHAGARSSRSVRVRRAIVAHLRAPGARAVRRPALELAARVRAGDSGAPVLTREGAVAGVVFAASRTREGTAYAVDSSALRRLLDGP